ncbi:MAG TPA: hypothetical protein VIO14_10735 [Dehalococcoidia bacterium]
MTTAALPYTFFLLMLELTAGGLWALLFADARGMVDRGFVKWSAFMLLASAAVTLWVALAVEVPGVVDGYRLDPRWMDPVRVVLGVLVGVCAAHTFATFRGHRAAGLFWGGAGSLVGLAALALTAGVFREPTWSYAGTLASLLAGSAALGTVSAGMVLGHWYLTTPRLSEQPLKELTLVLLGALAVQAAVMVVNAVPAVREVPQSSIALSVGLAQNPAFWFRVAVGLVFPAVLAYMAWKASAIRGMMSATGLLYIAMGAVLTGEVLARGLLFVTGKPV